MKKTVVNVATGAFVRGQERLTEKLAELGEDYLIFRNELPPGSPTHELVPYAFKSYALQEAATRGAKLLLWADASIVPIRSLDPIWDYTKEHGVWFADNGWNNAQWTCDAAYKPLLGTNPTEEIRRVNRGIKHVVATTFALYLDDPRGAHFLREYLHYAGNGAFQGPWWNSNGERADYASKVGAEPCGPPECLGHRHDQTAASVIAWRLGIPLTISPRYFTYNGQQTYDTIVIAKGI